MSDNIKVVVKVRPLIFREIDDKLPYQWRVQTNTLYQLDSNGRDYGQTFTFDKVYNEDTKTTDVYNDVAKPIVEAATAGFNGTIFAYGQTSSGKTYTMTGTETSPGIIPLSVLNLFEIIKNIPDRDFLVRVSYIEIYNETLKDLLDVNKKENIKIHETYDGSIKVDATERVTPSPEEVLEAMREGEANRQTGATNMNEKSSRSHSIFQIIIESREHIEGAEHGGSVNVSQLNLVDLAGSERAGQTGATGLRFKEGTHINKSLSALALVIKQLSEYPNKFANYRDSKLTRILQNSLGGNAKTSIICAITPAALEETVSTLQFATRAKAIKNNPEVNAVATDATMIQSLTKQLSKLQSQLEKKKNLEVMLETKKNVEQDLQKQIANLQKLILNGFAQRSSIEHISGVRRKLQPPRRITISSLHSIEEDPMNAVATIPRFCTPTLKYNPMVIPNMSEFVPTQSTNKLASLPEEPARLITPPPNDRKVNFDEDVIEIGSDDDDNSTIPTCSPYHKCYSQSKTPPCILRKNLNRAEKNYQDIMELTEREKMYKPDVVELMEKLEQATIMTAKLQDDVEVLKKSSKEKDLEMEHLKSKINKREEEVKNTKLELETRCKKYDTKVTDLEVIYETLQKKAKLREDELLSLLEEQKHKKAEEVGKIGSKLTEKDSIAFMDMSKDISLVNSDNDSIVNPNDEESSKQLQDLVANLQDQLIEKSQTIMQLEANMASQTQSIEVLEQSCNGLQELVGSFEAKLIYVENENGVLQSTVETLNTTIKNLKDSLEIAQNEMGSYNSVVQELQIKLSQKDSLLNIKIDDSVLESMISNEEKVLANNENMKNIIHSFKIALDNRSKEIEQLKSSKQDLDNSQVKTLNEDINDKTKHIEMLNEEMSELKEQLNDNIHTINKLMREKSNLASVELELTKKLAEVENQKTEFEEHNKEKMSQINSLKEANENLMHSMSNNIAKEQKYVHLNSELQNKINEMSNKITEIEKDIVAKDYLISTLSKQSDDHLEYEHQATSAVVKLKSIMSILSCEVQEIPELIDNFVTLFNALSTGLSTLEDVATDTVAEKNHVLKENNQLKTDIVDLHNKYDMETKTHLQEIEDLKKSVESHLMDNVNLLDINKKLSDDIIGHKNEIDTKRNEYNMLLEKCNSLHSKLLHQQDIVSLFNGKEIEYKHEIDELRAKLQNVNIALKTEHDQLQVKEKNLTDASITIEWLNTELKHKCDEITEIQQNLSDLAQVNKQLIENIYKKVCDITNESRIEISFSCEDVNDNCYEHVLLTLDQIKAHIAQINASNLKNENNMENQLCESRKEIESLSIENQELKIKLLQIETEHKIVSIELDKNTLESISINENLTVSSELLDQLKDDLKCKADEIECMKNKAKEWKKQFIDLEILMKKQMQDLQHENETLKARHLQLKNETQMQIDSVLKESDDSDLNFLFTTADNGDLNLRKSITSTVPYLKNTVETVSPLSLLTICCNTIVESMEPKQNDNDLVSTFSSDCEFPDAANTHSCSTCKQFSLDLQNLQEENSTLSAILEQLEAANKELIIEQEKIRQEVQLLIEPAQELQKKIASHKTNLSILTATTYAENKSLKSQVKGLQHHHGRFHHVCQRDIPEFKRQLRELLQILKGDTSMSEVQNVILKRYSLPDVLDNNCTGCNFKNESTLDGDLLMLDTNVTLTTTGDNTLVGCDQTCLDLTQTMYNEVSCQTNIAVLTAEPNLVHRQMSVLESDNDNFFQALQVLKDENSKLKALNDSFAVVSHSKVDIQTSPMKISSSNDYVLSTKCQIKNEPVDVVMEKELKNLTKRLADIQAEKENIEKKYNSLVLEMPNTDALVRKLTALEMEYNIKVNDLNKLTSLLNKKNMELKTFQEENDLLSTQVMENISEADDLNKELKNIKVVNLQLSEKILELESRSETNTFECPRCQSKDEVLLSVQSTTPHAKLNRSLSDSDTSSRYNKICTLQNELFAGREDCKTLTEDVASIKQHLDNSNMSMDLDESMGDSNVFTQAKPPNPQNTKCNMPEIQEERPLDIYTIDRIDCYNYYMEITGVDKEIVSDDTKIIEIMKMFYNKLLAKHGDEVENLANKLKDYEESNIRLQTQINEMVSKYSTTKKAIVDNEKDLSSVAKFISQIKSNINHIADEINTSKDSEVLAKIIQMFKHNFLDNLDYEFGIVSAKVFEAIVDKYQEDLMKIEKQYTSLQNQTDNLITEANNNLAKLNSELAEKKSEYDLLKAQKEKTVEISGAVTLDIVRKEEEMNKLVSEAYWRLCKLNLVTSKLDLTKATSEHINILIDEVISQHNKNNERIDNEKRTQELELNQYVTILDDKEHDLAELKSEIETLKNINNDVNLDLADKNVIIQTLKLAHDDLSKSYDSKIIENTSNLDLIDKLTAEISGLKEIISSKESIIASLSTRDAKTTELLNSIREIQEDNEKLKSFNQLIAKENESYSVDLEKSNETIKQNNIEIKKITSDILALREAVKDATLTIESLKQEVNKLSVDNSQLKINFEEKSRDCSRLEINIKTHEKTAEIQNRMIMRLQKQKDDDQVIGEQQRKFNEITEKYKTLESECEELKAVKESLEAKLAEMEEGLNKPRLSLDAIADSSRRRRQSIHDSKRLLGDLDEHRNLEAVFESRQKPDDLFMDIDGDDTSGRSTPFGLGRGRDSLLSKTESDKDEDHSSRPSSVLATRRRRQSIHDMHRGVARHTPSPHDLSSKLIDEHFRDTSGNRSGSGEVNQLREQLTSCQQQLEDLQEKFRELDDECETCAEYLRERDEQCIWLKKEKVALEKQVTELKSCNQMSQHNSKPSVAHVAVNTDEDWANLHAVVVDRMSYDAEVDKNKKLTRTIEELRFKKQDLKNTMAKMQKALDKYSSKTRELDATREELKGVKEELDELKLRYKELDEECETCAQYLKEREDQCRRLKEAKAALESKLQELQEDTHTAAHSHTVRKKRQTVHDLNRNSVVDQNDVSTETSDDLLNYQVERDESTRRVTEDQQRETKRHRMIIEKLTHQKAALEKQLKNMQAAPAPNPVYVATGSAIVQNQQLTDVMKENQKLKKINAKLVNICKKRGKSDANRENEDPCEQG